MNELNQMAKQWNMQKKWRYCEKKTEKQISFNMRQVECKDSKIEVILRQELWKRGIRYRKNVKKILGKPDIAFMSKKIAVFVDGEFWHGFNWAVRKKDFKTHQEFWIPKIERNIERDKEVSEILESLGWTVIRFWGNEVKEDVIQCADIIQKAMDKNNEQKK